MDFILKKQYADAAKYMPLTGTSAADAVADMTNKQLNTTKLTNVYLITVISGGACETWWSQKTYSEMNAVSGIILDKWAYGYFYQEGTWYAILGRPSSECLALQLLSIFSSDTELQNYIHTFRFDDYSDDRIPSNQIPLMMIAPSGDREWWGESERGVGYHDVDMLVYVAFYQRISKSFGTLNWLEKRVRERITDILYIENQRLDGYIAESPVSVPPFDDVLRKDFDNHRGEIFRMLVLAVGYRDKISNKANERVY